jgi:uracil-DNA glycosylase
MLGAQPTVSDMQDGHPSPTDSLALVTAEVVECTQCPRLVDWRRLVAIEKRASYRSEEYWARPVPGFGDPAARVLVVGLAPAAHGGNRTGRIFTGDRSGDWLFGSLWRTGFANQPTSVSISDGLALTGCYVTAAVRCAPPANRPTPDERDRCRPYLVREMALLSEVRVVVVLGQFAFDVVCRLLAVRPRPRFGHLAEVQVAGVQVAEVQVAGVQVAEVQVAGEPRNLTIVCSFHPSQQNTFTGKLTEPMLDAVFLRARALSGLGEV